MAITYAVGTNTITVTGYTEGTPCNFTDIYNADKAGTLSLHARTGITGVDGAAVAVDRAERPADYVVLGGASNDLYIVVTNWNGTNATIQIIGTDRDNSAQVEYIAITGNGKYYTGKWFKTITHTEVTAFTGTSFDYDLIQGQWGVITLNNTSLFCITCKLKIGDGSTTTWFADVNKQVMFDVTWMTANYQNPVSIYDTAVFRLGKVYNAATKATEDGCQIYALTSGTYYFRFIMQYTSGIVQLLSTTFKSSTVARETFINLAQTDGSGDSKIWNCFFEEGVYLSGVKDVDLYNLVFARTTSSLRNLKTGVTAEKISGIGCFYGVYFTSIYDSTIKDIWIRDVTYGIMCNNYSGTGTIINGDFSSWIFRWYGTSSATIYRKYTFNLKVLDKDNVAINGATVKMWDKDDSLIVDTTTNASGVIAEQTLSYGYYNQANGNTLQSYSPHTLTIEKAGYQKYKSKFTLDEKIDWIIRLIHSNVCVDQEVML